MWEGAWCPGKPGDLPGLRCTEPSREGCGIQKKRRTDEFSGAPPFCRSGPFFFAIMSIRTLRFVVAFLMSAITFATSQTPVDSSGSGPTYHFPTVTVEGSRLLHRSASTLGSVVSVSRSTLDRLAGRSVDAVLSDEAGLFVRDVGGSGGVKTVSIRGSAANQTVVVYNGIRVNSMQNGLADLGLLPVELFDAVEIVRGGQSAHFGPDATSGAVILSSSARNESGAGIRVRVGSFVDRACSVNGTMAGEDASITMRVGTESTGGSFPFPWIGPEGPTTYWRDGSSFRRTFGSVSAILRRNEKSRLETSLTGVLADRGSPGPVTAGGWTQARLRDGLVLGTVRLFSVGTSTTMWEGGISGTFQDETFEEVQDLAGSVDRYDNRNVNGWIHGRHALSSELVVGWGLESFFASLTGSAFAAGTKRSGGSVLAHLDWTGSTHGLKVLPSARLDMFSDLSPKVSPRLALEMPIGNGQDVRLRASVGAGFRMPSFNELYWRPGGNKDLTHERTTSADVAAEVRFVAWGEQRMTGGGFASDTRNRITGWPPVNIARTTTRGFEWSWYWTVERSRAWWTGSWTAVENRASGSEGKQIPFMPRQIMTAGIDVVIGPLTATPVIQYHSRRFLTSENLTALSVPPSTRASISAAWEGHVATVACRMTLVMNNVFDVADLSLPGYPLPGRSLTFHTTIAFDVKGEE